ncbi:MAG: bifunctional oligoribonuclease/PAP phosphatase NrnA [Deltaproteobacteria bacterium]|nr:bifunctional oligoribonuclease/PAP phosphatase NrnA [Deltaproteobacteria bacterium]
MTAGNLSEIVKIIRAARRVVLVTHTFPDGDALGSQLGLGHILQDMGKEVILYGEEPISYLYEFLPCCARMVKEPPRLEVVDCAISLDCGDRFRLGKGEEQLLKIKPFIAIDHHAGHQDFGDLRWVVEGRASTGDMVYDLSQLLGAEVSYEAAYCLYTAIVSDTGSFKYASTTADTFRIAGALLAKGVKPAEVSGKLFDNFTESRLQLLQVVLSTLEIYGDGRLAIISATKKMFDLTGADKADTETFINYPRSLAKVRVAALIKEIDGAIGVSMRSKGDDCDVAVVARKFNGGGHRNAAGCKFRDGETLHEVRDLIFAELLPLVHDK